ncbi:hypothetical protein I314_06341 [Cryptococcus bacillisporus CA1873]|uniref:Uncharacterized protein n=1 Tax=Cryptococcus bacillisporus CA1873 TaxID=1296111 RepID=A0ABR5B2L7_CRYGA|nr:hypothetical protein I314_06341 [Cryptococcus bacillisporus CA1873]|eukprot:KIR57836.1 hypothetical protein I314_06341 [Cryptococcus gattii CA1873]
MGLSQSSQGTQSPLPAPQPSLPSHAPQSILSLFLPATPPLLTHDHIPPTLSDITLVTCYLVHLGLPLELALRILDEARYWDGCRRESKKEVMVYSTRDGGYVKRGLEWLTGQEEEVPEAAMAGDGGLEGGKGKVWYLVSSPIGCFGDPDPMNTRVGHGERTAWVKEVVIETFSKDQGWSNYAQHYGTYDSSYSWFEVSLLRGDKEVPGSRHIVQHNVHAGQYCKYHTNTLTIEHPTLQLAQQGDRIVLWVRALYPGWSNWIREGAITVFSAPFPQA